MIYLKKREGVLKFLDVWTESKLKDFSQCSFQFHIQKRWAYALDRIHEKYENITKEIVEQAKLFPTNREKLKFLYDWFVENVSYDFDAVEKKHQQNADLIFYNFKDFRLRSFSPIMAVVLKKGVCASFAYALKDFCDRVDIKCKVVRDNRHCWNEVLLDGRFLTVDVTTGICSKNDEDEGLYRDFLSPLRQRNDERIMKK